MRLTTKIDKRNIHQLLKDIKTMHLTVPEFQRGFVWNKRKIKDLFDSLISHWPIGSFVIWETNKEVESRSLFDKNEKSLGKKYYLLDGQQRLLSIYYLYNQKEFHKIRKDFQEICASWNKDIINFEHFFIDNLRNKAELKYSKDKSNEFDKEKFLKLIGERYRLPIIKVKIDDYGEAIKIFRRINTSGTPISTESIFFAEAWNKKTDLGKNLRKWKSKNKDKISSKLNNIIFIHTFAVIIQLEEVYWKNKDKKVDISLKTLEKIAEHILKDNSSKYKKVFDNVIKSVNEAVNFLSVLKINNVHEIPSQTMVTILSIFYYYTRKLKLDPGPFQMELKKWFWRSVVSDRYIGKGYTTNVRYDPKYMYLLANERKLITNVVKSKEIDKKMIKETSWKSGRSTLKDAIKLMLWNMNPKDLNGIPIENKEYESSRYDKEDDHFYSDKILNKKLNIDRKLTDSVCNLVYLRKYHNASKNAILPHMWFIKKEKEMTSKYEKLFFDSHLLKFKSFERLKYKEKKLLKKDEKTVKPAKMKKYYNKFLDDRADLFLGKLMKLQKKGNV